MRRIATVMCLSTALLLGSLGCGGATAAGPTPAAAASRPTAAPAFAPTPYTAEQIRDATRPGRRWEWREETTGPDGATVVRTKVVEFLEVTPTDGRLRSATLDAAGRPARPERVSRARWEELRRHAEFPAAATTVTDETVTVPAGTFACRVYTVVGREGGAPSVARFAFAQELPGPPVRFTIDVGGRRVSTSTLVRYSAGAPR